MFFTRQKDPWNASYFHSKDSELKKKDLKIRSFSPPREKMSVLSLLFSPHIVSLQLKSVSLIHLF